MLSDKRLVTRKEFDRLSPRAQGYASYMQGALPGSELKDCQKNPYAEGTTSHMEFKDGQAMGVQVAQDSEEG